MAKGKIVDRFLKAVNTPERVEKYGAVKKWEVVLTLASKGYSENALGELFGCDPKTIQAMKVDLTKKGKAEWVTGKRVHRPVKDYLKDKHVGLMDKTKFFSEVAGKIDKKRVVAVVNKTAVTATNKKVAGSAVEGASTVTTTA